jgi:uncharacterized protein (TIRG00374 family)
MKINTKAMLGIFAPLGLGGDVLRAYHAKKEDLSAEKALSSGFVVKFFKFLILILFLISAMYVLSVKSTDLAESFVFFGISLAFAAFGALAIALLRVKRVAAWLYKGLNRLFIMRFHRALNKQFFQLSPKKICVVVFLLIISTLFEIAAIIFSFLTVGQWMPLDRFFVFAAVASTLSLVTITPQGIGFVEGGGFFILQLGFFSLGLPVIGSFLIVWNLVRVWIPSLVGAIFTWVK